MVTAAQAYWLNRKRRRDRNQGVAPPYEMTNDDAIALVARFSTEPDDRHKRAIDRLFTDMADAGIPLNTSGPFDAFYVMAAADAQSAQRNWVQDLYNLTPTNSPAFEADRGYTGNGSTSYLATGFNPSIAPTPKFVLNSAHMGLWSLTNLPNGAASSFDFGDNSRSSIGRSITDGASAGRINTSTLNPTQAVGAYPGHAAWSRSAADAWKGYAQGVEAGGGTHASTAVATAAFRVCAQSGAGFGVNQLAVAHFGEHLTPIEMSAVYSALRAYLDAIGAIADVSADAVSYPTGATTWFNDPRSIELDNGSLLLGGVRTDGSVVGNVVTDGEAGRQSMIHRVMQADDHDNPGLLKRASDGRVLAFYAQHSDNSYFVRLSDDAECSGWGAFSSLATSLGGTFYTYACPFQLTGEVGSPVHLFLRCDTDGQQALHHAVLDENGAVVDAAERVLAQLKYYFKLVQNGDSRIDIFANSGVLSDGAPSNPYHFYYQAGAFHDTDGNALTLPIDLTTDLTPIHSGYDWVFDARIIDGKPAIGYVDFTDLQNHRYRRAIRNDADDGWVDEEVCTGGAEIDDSAAVHWSQGYYSGGICLDPDDADVVYCCRQVSGVHQLFKMTKVGLGNWSAEQLTFGSEKCFRPYVIPGTRKLQYVCGSYMSYTIFDTRIKVTGI